MEKSEFDPMSIWFQNLCLKHIIISVVCEGGGREYGTEEDWKLKG